MRRARPAIDLLGPVALIVAVALIGTTQAASTQEDFISALVLTTMVVALYVFIGPSGVISFGHIAFVAIGAFAAGVMTIEATVKPTVLPELFPFIADNSIGNVESLALGAGLGAIFALVTGIPLMRLSGLAAGIATFAVLVIVHNVLRFWDKIGPGATTLSLVPETTGIWQAAIGALIVAAVAFAYQRSRFGRLLRATREDPAAAQAAGIRIHRQRLIAFTLSGALAGFAGALLVHQLGSIGTEQVYLQLTFLTLAMLVIGGSTSLLGAVLGALLVSFVDAFLVNAENGANIGFATLTLPIGSSILILGVILALFLILRPSGITGGRELSELSLPRLPRRRHRAQPTSGEPGGTGEQTLSG